MSQNLKEKILILLKKDRSITTQAVAGMFKVSRNYAHLLLKQLREEGEVSLIGKTNRATYVLASDKKSLQKAQGEIKHIFFRLINKNLSEDAILERIEKETGIMLGVKENVNRIFRHAFTEMLNNAIDHSRSEKIEVDCRRTGSALTFVVRDFGIGIFNNVQTKFHLPGTLAAIQEILKGKATTAPEQHTGEGVFFTSKMADVFIIDSFEKRLTVNNLIPDIFIADRKPLQGTRVSFSAHLSSNRNIRDVFGAFTGSADDGFAFDKTKVTVKLFQFGHDLPSRSEAKRVTLNLENFREVELDFMDVETVGQAFADEIFRVWHNRHQDIKLVVTNANENVTFMIQRAGG
ncbi:MAG: DUF4325 domain-containing protein [Patescibacteria group bacterium]|jgi:anti-sigma regulatory factor (Ser/Thr protein kinase)